MSSKSSGSSNGKGNKIAPMENNKNNCSIIKLNNLNNNKNNKNSENLNKSCSFPIDENIPPPSYSEGNKEEKENSENKTKLFINEKGKLYRHKGLSFKITLLNFLKTLVGAGFLSLPLAFKNAGLWTGLIMTILFAFLNCLCMMQLVKCAQFFYRQFNIPFLSYGDLARQTCSISFRWIRPYKNISKAVVDSTILFLEFGFCSTYYLFIAITLKEFYEEFFHMSSSSSFQWLMAIYIPMVLFNFLRTLKFIAWLSTFGNFCIVGSLAFLLQYVIRYPNYTIGEMPFFNTFDGLLTAAGSIIYSFEAQTLVLPMENKLKKPGQMLGPFGILSGGIFLASLVYSSIGFFGYVAYGDKIKGSITQNLPQHQISFTIVKLAICISVLASFLLQMYVIVEIVWTKCHKLLFVERDENKNSELKT
ncbi:Aa_trans domain-containing protein [Meloidogyne graminicola]|uniref:Aa_trans domain-containing protein n=1 Tax=Meloidogyne graminicola TaxID=189291 RepID=A0A8S9ZVD1_9BILA|nr:Aa_trans domain-containing protein [Meloidogyne graminicola]